MATIYLVSETGAARADSEAAAAALEVVGFRRCSWSEYTRRMRLIAREDAKVTERPIVKDRS